MSYSFAMDLVGSRRALLFGSCHYADDALVDLSCAEADVVAMAAVLSDPTHGKFETKPLSPDVTRDAIMEALTISVDGLNEGDTFVLYYSGHAFRDDQGRLYLALQGTDLKRTYTAASLDELLTVIDNSRTGRVAIILDCCFSGAIQASFSALKRPRDVWVVAASTSGESALEKQGNTNSILTGFLVDGISSGFTDTDQSGSISVYEAYQYASRLVAAALEGTGHVQEPTIFVPTGGRGELVLAANPLAQKVDLADIPQGSLPLFLVARGIAELVDQNGPYRFAVMLREYLIEGFPVRASMLTVAAAYTPNMVVHADRFDCDAFFSPELLSPEMIGDKPVVEGRVKVRMSVPFDRILMIAGMRTDADGSEMVTIYSPSS